MSGRFWLISILSLLAALLVGTRVISSISSRSEAVNGELLWVGDIGVLVEVADESEEMKKGLGYRDSLDSNSGMLFIYPKPIIPVFWMKGMRFDLDFIWIRDEVVVELTQNVVSPKSEDEQLPAISPRVSVDWILEVNAGWVDDNHIEIGDAVRWE